MLLKKKFGAASEVHVLLKCLCTKNMYMHAIFCKRNKNLNCLSRMRFVFSFTRLFYKARRAFSFAMARRAFSFERER